MVNVVFRPMREWRAQTCPWIAGMEDKEGSFADHGIVTASIWYTTTNTGQRQSAAQLYLFDLCLLICDYDNALQARGAEGCSPGVLGRVLVNPA